MYYLHIYLEDNTVEYFCSKDISLLFKAVKECKNDWTVGNKTREFPEQDYLEFEITSECEPLNFKRN